MGQGRIGGVRLRQKPEGMGQQRVPGQQRRRLVKGLVGRGASPAKVVIVHAGQVVMDEGVGVQALHGDGGG